MNRFVQASLISTLAATAILPLAFILGADQGALWPGITFWCLSGMAWLLLWIGISRDD